MDVVETLLEEVALDGLEGLTIQSLWYRLEKTQPKFPLTLSDKTKKYLWESLIARNKEFEFYELPEDREPFRDVEEEYSDTGVVIYKPCCTIKMLPCCYIDTNGDRGSCSTYHTRVNITEQIHSTEGKPVLTFKEVVEKFGDRLVIVAVQSTRERFLFQDATDPGIAKSKMTVELYCNLEFIARSRRNGTYGSDALAFLQQSAESKATHGLMGYFRKKLKQFNVMVKIPYTTMKPTMTKAAGQTLRLSQEAILFLPRFLTPRDTIYTSCHRSVEELLLTKPERKCFLADIAQELGQHRRKVHKVLREKTQFFEFRYIRQSGNSSRAVEPDNVNEEEEEEDSMDVDAAPTDNPNENEPSADSQDLQDKPTLLKKRKVVSSSRNHLVVKLIQTIKEAEEAEENENEYGEVMLHEGDSVTPQLRRIDTSLLVQFKEWVHSLGPKGATKMMLREAFGLHTLQARQMMKFLSRNKSFHFYYTEHKRQKVERMCSIEYATHYTVAPQHNVNLKGGDVPVPAASTGLHAVDSSNSLTSLAEAESSPLTHSTPAPSTSSTPVTACNTVPGGRLPKATNRHLTNKTIERSNTIISLAQKHRLILFPDLNKLIQGIEADKYDTKIDRKTLKRLCAVLHKENKIKLLQTTVRVESRERELYYICEPNMTIGDKLMQSSLEAQRSELTSNVNNNKLAMAKIEKKEQAALAKQKGEESVDPLSIYTQDSKICSVKYGYGAKMKRVETLHRFLCYVVYNYEGRTDLAEQKDSDGKVVSADGDPSKLNVYTDTHDWRRFLAPGILGTQDGDCSGRACVIDLGTQLPLSLFLVLVKLPYNVPAIVEYLSDPIKSLIPVKHLSTDMQAPLLHKRKYIHALKDIISLMCMMGLATNISKVDGGVTYRDISVVYLHKKASIVNTSGGVLKHDMSEEEREAKTIIYRMDHGSFEVEDYWMVLRDVCTSTPLPRAPRNQPKSLDEQETFRADMVRNKALKQIIVPKTMAQVKELVVPGDGKGAGGLDTLFYSSLGRHWQCSVEKMVPAINKLGNRITPGSTSLEKRQPEIRGHLVPVKPTMQPIKRPASSSSVTSQPKATPAVKKRKTEDRKRKVETTNPPKDPPTKIKKVKYEARRAKDDIDRVAERHLQTKRSAFTPKEDEALLLAKIGLNIIGCKEVATKPIRDFLHRQLPALSKDKSSSACWARLCRVIQFGKKDRTLHLYTTIALNNPEIAKLKDQEPLLASSTFSENYTKLMDLLLVTCGNASDSEMTVDLSTITDIEDLRAKYNLIPITESKEAPRFSTGYANNHAVAPPFVVEWDHPATDTDIVKYSLTNFTTAYLLIDDKANRNYQVHKVFEQYPTMVVDAVYSALQTHKVATIRRNQQGRTMKTLTLSYRYRLFRDRIQVVSMETFICCCDALSNLWESKGSLIEYANVEEWRGHLINFLSLSPTRALQIEFDLPEKVLDTTNINQSDDEDDEEEADDLVAESRPENAREKKSRMKFEHCQIKPCTVRARLNSELLPDVLKVTKQDDRRYIKSMMSSIPYNVNTEDTFKELEQSCSSPDVQRLRRLFDEIDKYGMAGISLYALHTVITESDGLESISLNELQDDINTLTNCHLVLGVGIAVRTYITHNHRRMWVIHSLRDTKGRGSGVAITDDDKVNLAEGQVTDTPPLDPTQNNGIKSISQGAAPKPKTTFQRVDIIPKPWLTTEGTINYQVLYPLLTSVISTINKYQSINFANLHMQFSMVYSPVVFLDLLQILEDLGCVNREYTTSNTPAEPSLFSKRSTYTLSDRPLNAHSQAHYSASQQAMQRLSLFILNTRQNHGVVSPAS